jgi:hypothetical protein
VLQQHQKQQEQKQQEQKQQQNMAHLLNFPVADEVLDAGLQGSGQSVRKQSKTCGA